MTHGQAFSVRHATPEDIQGLLDRHAALLERVTVLERALEEIAEGRWNVGAERDLTVREFAQAALDG